MVFRSLVGRGECGGERLGLVEETVEVHLQVSCGQVQVEVPEYLHHRHLHLQLRQLLPDAGPRTSTKGEMGVGLRSEGFPLPRQPAFGVKIVRVVEILGDVVIGHRVHHEDRPLLHRQLPEHQILGCLSDEYSIGGLEVPGKFV